MKNFAMKLITVLDIAMFVSLAALAMDMFKVSGVFHAFGFTLLNTKLLMALLIIAASNFVLRKAVK